LQNVSPGSQIFLLAPFLLPLGNSNIHLTQRHQYILMSHEHVEQINFEITSSMHTSKVLSLHPSGNRL
jgi:hypothetical protein